VRMMGVPIRMHATPGRARTAPPTLGQHTAGVLREVLGLGPRDVARLRAAGVV